MANNSDRWYFTKEQLDATPSRKCGYDSYKELSYRQQTANFIQDMGQRLKVSQLCINTAIVYMHRFYVFHSFTHFPWHQMGAAALFLAAKVEEQHRKLEYVIRVANMCRNNRDANIDVKSDRYIAQSQDLIFNETVLLQTLGFDVAIDHPHTHVVRCCHLVRASKDLAQSSYFLASNSLHLTTMCLQYKPTVVACFCIHLACKWSRWEIPLSTERKEWFRYVDSTVTTELLQQLTDEFLLIYESCPSRLKEKIMSIGDNGMPSCITNSPNDASQKKTPNYDQNDLGMYAHRTHESKSGSETDPIKHRSSRPHEASSSGGSGSSSATTSGTSSSQQQKEREYREKKEREKLAQQHMKGPPANAASKQPPPHGHHRPPVDPKLKQAHRPSSSYPGTARPAEPRDILREAAKDSPFGIAREKGEVPKSRDYLLKPNVVAETNYYNGDGNKVGPSRTSSSRPVIDPNKVPIKHEQARRHEEKAFTKPDGGDVKRSHGSTGAGVSGHDRNSYLNKSLNSSSSSTSVKGADASKSVLPKPAAVNAGGGGHQAPPPIPHQPPQVKQHHHNGAPKEEPLFIKEEVLPTPPVKKPSLFSPEKSPETKREMLSPVRSSDSFSFPALSPLKSPTVANNTGSGRRARNHSSSSEPELRPVLKKIDQMEGFETLLRDSTIGINKLHQVPDIITPINDIKEEPSINFSKEMKPPDIIPPLGLDNISAAASLVNGIETNPTLISSLLKEAPPVSHLPAVKQESEPKERGEHHHKSKKKNKEKHKHKDKEKSRDDKEKKKKHKDKEKEKHKHKEKEKAEPVAEPIKIKIPKDKIQSVVPINPLKMKIAIPKESKTESSASHGPAAAVVAPNPAPVGGLKIKIPREVINNCSEVDRGRKRERSGEGGGGGDGAPPPKQSRSGKEAKQNGRHSYSKVTQLGDGDASIHRLAESKYINKSSTS